MAILINKNTRVLVQGITGKEGARATKEMLAYGTNVVAGVTPGKGGQTIEGVLVFNGVAEAVAKFPEINTSLVTVPAPFALDAVLESIYASIKLINILTEKVPVRDVATMIAFAHQYGAQIVGPSSVGILVPKIGKIGSIGGADLIHTIFTPGPVGLISKSGGMTAEISQTLTKAGLGQSAVVGIGGDVLIGSDFVDIALQFEQNLDTKVIVVFGEVGGTYEEQLAAAIKDGRITKPVVALIAGKFAESLPQDTVLGHAGAIVNRGRGTASGKIKALQEAGALIAEIVDDLPALIKKVLQ